MIGISQQVILARLARKKNNNLGLTLKQLGYNESYSSIKKTLYHLKENNWVEQIPKTHSQQPRYKLTEKGRKRFEKTVIIPKNTYKTRNHIFSTKQTTNIDLKNQGILLKLEEAQKHIRQLEKQILELQNVKNFK